MKTTKTTPPIFSECQIVPISNGISKICRFHDIARTFWALIIRPCLSNTHSAYFKLKQNQYLSILRFTAKVEQKYQKYSKSPQVVAYKSFLFENSDAYYSYQTCGSSNECLNEYVEIFKLQQGSLSIRSCHTSHVVGGCNDFIIFRYIQP